MSRDRRLEIQTTSTVTTEDVTHSVEWWREVLAKVDAKWQAAKDIDDTKKQNAT